MTATDWLSALVDCRGRGEAAVLVTVAGSQGSAPREAGAKMLVTSTRLAGTIGGGALEHGAVQHARSLLRDGAVAPVLDDVPLGPALGQCCGGKVVLMFDPIRPPATTLYLFGAGHVGREVVAVLAPVPDLRIVWIDGRDDQFPPDPPPGVRCLVSDLPEAEALEAPPGAMALVMTHSHDLDLRLVETMLRRGDFGWLGLIGSATKRARFVRRLEAKGLDCSRLVCPIGLEGIGGKHPRTIAVSVAAQLLQVTGQVGGRVGGAGADAAETASGEPSSLRRC